MSDLIDFEQSEMLDVLELFIAALDQNPSLENQRTFRCDDERVNERSPC